MLVPWTVVTMLRFRKNENILTLKSLFIYLVNGATFTRNMHLWDAELTMSVSPMKFAKSSLPMPNSKFCHLLGLIEHVELTLSSYV